MSPAPSRYRFVIEAILFASYAVFGVSWFAISPLRGSVKADFGIDDTAFSLISSLVSFAKIVAPLLTGLLAVRIGLKRTLLLGSVLIACAVLAPFAEDFGLFLASRFVFGIGGAMVVTLLGAVVLQWFPKGELPIVNAFNNVAVNTGIAITFFATPLLEGPLGWRGTLTLYGGMSVVLAVAWALFGRDREAGPAAGRAAAEARYVDIWRLKETWLVALCFAGPLALYLALNTFLSAFYQEAWGMEKTTANGYLALLNTVGIPAAIAGGWLTRRVGLRRPFILFAGVLIGFAAFGMFTLPNLLWPCAVALGVALFLAASPLITTAMELPGMTPGRVSLMMGTVLSFSYVLSSLSPMLVGFLKEQTGSFVPGFAVWAAFSWVVALCGLLLPETGPAGVKAAKSEAA